MFMKNEHSFLLFLMVWILDACMQFFPRSPSAGGLVPSVVLLGGGDLSEVEPRERLGSHRSIKFRRH
jgi:hypothetical protein